MIFVSQKHLQRFTKADKERLSELIGKDVYVSGEMYRADLKQVQKDWAEEVKDLTHGRYKGEVRDYDREGEPWTTGDMRDTWSLCLVDPKTDEVVWYQYFLPLADVDGQYEYERELADDVISGLRTLAEAKKSAQYHAAHTASEEFESQIDVDRFDLDEFLRGRSALAE